jgi:tetratricopeptide (TPR) repeat protein
MSAADFDRVRSIFLAARDLDAARRRDLLRRECAGNAALWAEVESLLKHHDAERGRATPPFLSGAVGAILESGGLLEAPLPRPFGTFELLAVIGRGGMGTVYRARQRTPDRTVALKVIRPGMLSPAMLARFRYEVDVLARLHHPGIAQIFEAGMVEAGTVAQPYFALELVAGSPIDSYADEHGLDVRQRVALLVKVCDAVHHAHQKGVIHRDLKPGNILVDGNGQPKVLDFGVARATGADVRTTTLRTHAGQLVGTLPYMSPEQISGDPLRLDVRSDVYALGVLTFELLTGRLPHDLGDRSIADAALVLRDAAPARLGDVAPSLRGDLETITAKALEKEPARRYGSAAELAEDLRRYLAHQPITARPPSVTYQLRLFARRHRAVVAGGALAAAALVVAAVVSIAFAVDAGRAADRAARQRRVAERTNEHLEAMLMLPDPHGKGAAMTVVEMLDSMIERLKTDAEEDLPEIEAEVRSAIGRTYASLRQPHRAAEQLERAVERWRAAGEDGPKLADTLLDLGYALIQLGDGDRSEAAYREAAAILDEVGGRDRERGRSGLLNLLVRRQKHEEAAPIARELLDAARRRSDPLGIIAGLRQIARVEAGLGAHDGAERSLSEARSLALRHFPEMHPMVLGVLTDLCSVRQTRGDLDGAIEAAAQAHDLAERTQKPGSYDWMVCTNSYLSLLEALDRREEALDLLVRSRAALASALGEDHRLVREADLRLARVRDRSDGTAPMPASARPPGT